nr:TlpA family protein disulfide reductase [uncultured Carboxylicivirga sp.]
MKKILPLLLTVSFAFVLFANTALSKWNNNSIFRNYGSIDEPVREALANNDFLYDEKDTEIIVINLWATWCKPCQKEIPELNKVLNKYEQDNVLFLALTSEKQSEVTEWMDLQKNQFMYFQLFEQQNLMNYLFQLNPDSSYKNGQKPESYPTNIIIKNKKLIYFEIGYSDESIEKMEVALKNAMK